MEDNLGCWDGQNGSQAESESKGVKEDFTDRGTDTEE